MSAVRFVDTNVLLYAVSAMSEDLSPEQDYDGLRVINPFTLQQATQ